MSTFGLMRVSFCVIYLVVVSPDTTYAQNDVQAVPQVGKGRFVKPTGGNPGYVRLDCYFELPDPHEAARLLLEEATLAGLDLDATGKDLRQRRVQCIPAPKMALEGTARAYMSDSIGENKSDSTWCVVKFSRVCSIREMASLLDNGIRVYRHEGGCFVALVPGDKEKFLGGQEYIQWFQPYTATMKLYPNYEFPHGHVEIDVHSLAGNREEFAHDLEGLGADVLGSEGGVYWIGVDGDRIRAIAELEWVYTVTPRTWTAEVVVPLPSF
jgi:hypothetical protein